ncbi:MAG: response regulator [Deltaproteobacteria bacterium]|nr:response regulator [Deltaproteobacteria bacterium]
MLRILIIDDHPDTAETIAMLLEAMGHDARVACTGTEGLDLVDRFRPDLVILDIGLPDISGYEVARGIRSRPLGSFVYLVAATGWGAPEDRVRALAAGFDQHQLKPLDLRKLQGMIAKAIERFTPKVRAVASSPA